MPYGIHQKLLKVASEATEDLDLQMVAILSGKSPEELLKGDIAEYLDLKAQAAFLYLVPKANKVAESYKLGDLKLIPVCDHRKMLTSQFLDVQEYLKGKDQVVEILSCFLVPEGKTYGEGYDVLDVQAAIRDKMSVCDVAALQDFFFAKLRKSMLYSLISSARMTRKIQDKTIRKSMRLQILQAERSLISGGGFPKSKLLRVLPTILGLWSTTYRRLLF